MSFSGFRLNRSENHPHLNEYIKHIRHQRHQIHVQLITDRHRNFVTTLHTLDKHELTQRYAT